MVGMEGSHWRFSWKLSLKGFQGRLVPMKGFHAWKVSIKGFHQRFPWKVLLEGFLFRLRLADSSFLTWVMLHTGACANAALLIYLLTFSEKVPIDSFHGEFPWKVPIEGFQEGFPWKVLLEGFSFPGKVTMESFHGGFPWKVHLKFSHGRFPAEFKFNRGGAMA